MLTRTPAFELANPFRLKNDCWQNCTQIMIRLKSYSVGELAAIPVLFFLYCTLMSLEVWETSSGLYRDWLYVVLLLTMHFLGNWCSMEERLSGGFLLTACIDFVELLTGDHHWRTQFKTRPMLALPHQLSCFYQLLSVKPHWVPGGSNNLCLTNFLMELSIPRFCFL